MKSNWRVSSQDIGDERIYRVYRLIDIDGVDHSGNREYHCSGCFESGEEAQHRADMANGEISNEY